jgi:hypothetical protein
MNVDRQKTESELWQDYLFLTKEMAKCLVRDDFPLFEELLLQREKLQPMLEACRISREDGSGFTSEQDRTELLALVRTANTEVESRLNLYYLERKNQSVAAMAYEGLDDPLVGMRMDKQR